MYRLNSQRVLRHIVLSSLASCYRLTGQIPSALEKNRVQFLYLHHLFEDEKDAFRNLLMLLSRRHSFISYSEAVDRILQGKVERPYIAFSFDDGLKNCLGAASIMNEFGIKACFFLCTSMVGETDYAKIKEFCLQKIHMPPVEFLSWLDVERLLKDGHEIGSHTITHRRLAQISTDEIQAEIAGSFELLTKRIGSVKHFSWPGGRFFHFSPPAARVVFETGFISCASAERGCHLASQPEIREPSLCIRRDRIVAKWPIKHILYFMARNSRMASIHNNQWPLGWLETI